MKYRVGRKKGTVILDENGREVAHCKSMDIADTICSLLNTQKQFKNNVALHDVSKCYTEKDMDNAYDKGFKDGNQRDLTGSLIEVL